MIFVCFVVFTFLFVAFFGGGKLSLDFHDLFYKVLIYISTLENHRKAGVGKSPNQSFLFI